MWRQLSTIVGHLRSILIHFQSAKQFGAYCTLPKTILFASSVKAIISLFCPSIPSDSKWSHLYEIIAYKKPRRAPLLPMIYFMGNCIFNTTTKMHWIKVEPHYVEAQGPPLSTGEYWIRILEFSEFFSMMPHFEVESCLMDRLIFKDIADFHLM